MECPSARSPSQLPRSAKPAQHRRKVVAQFGAQTAAFLQDHHRSARPLHRRGGLAAVDGVGLTCDPGGLIGRKIGRKGASFFQLTTTRNGSYGSAGCQRCNRVRLRLRGCHRKIGFDKFGTDCATSDAGSGDIQGQGPDQAVDSGLGCAIGDHPADIRRQNRARRSALSGMMSPVI